jgi:hypothetical protein
MSKFTKEISVMNYSRHGKVNYTDGLAAAIAVDRTVANTCVELNGYVVPDGKLAGTIVYQWPGYHYE